MNQLKLRNTELETQVNLMNEVNKQLEDKLDELLKNGKFTNNEQINQSIMTLSKKNAEMEKQLKILMEELNETKRSSRSQEDRALIDRLNDEKLLLVKSYEQKINDLSNETQIESLKKEKMVLSQTVDQLQEEIRRLNQKPNADLPTLSRLNKEILSGQEMVREAVTTTEQSQEILDCNGEQSEKSEVDVLKEKVAALEVALEVAQQGSRALENQVRSLRADGRTGGGKARVARDDELAWSHLYGIKSVRHAATSQSRSKPQQTQLPPFDKDSEEFIEVKVKELEQELEKAKEEILRQRLESNFRLQAIMPSASQNVEVLELKKKVLDLENSTVNNDSLKFSLQTKTAEMAVGLNEKRQLEFELENLKSRLQREFVPKIDAEVAKLQADLLVKRLLERSEAPIMEDTLRERLEVLARERERADALRRRLNRQVNYY